MEVNPGVIRFCPMLASPDPGPLLVSMSSCVTEAVRYVASQSAASRWSSSTEPIGVAPISSGRRATASLNT